MAQQQQMGVGQRSFNQINQNDGQAQTFTRIKVGDAINIIALRLGRVEQWIIATENENSEDKVPGSETGGFEIPENYKILEDSVISSIVDRISILENTTGNPVSESEQVSLLSGEVSKLTEQLTRVGDEVTKHTLAIAKHTEQMFKFERDLVETKDILKSFMMKYDLFAKDTIDKFVDFDFAMIELEKSINVSNSSQPIVNDNAIESNDAFANNENGESSELNQEEIELSETNDINNIILSEDLKNSINEELIAST
jgi:hypothetical protein